MNPLSLEPANCDYEGEMIHNFLVEKGDELYQGVVAAEALAIWLQAAYRGDRGQCEGGVTCLRKAEPGSLFCSDHKCVVKGCGKSRTGSFHICTDHIFPATTTL